MLDMNNAVDILSKVKLRQTIISSIKRKAAISNQSLNIHERAEITFYKNEISRLELRARVIEC